MLIIKKIFAVSLAAIVLLSTLKISTHAQSYNAKGLVLINAHTGEILKSQNPHEKLPMASTTKMMTALILAESKNLDEKIVVTDKMVNVEGSSMGLLPGDTVSYYDLLVGMMLSSGNDAANSTAISVAGSVEAFAVLMNKRANEIGMLNTNFVTPSGLDSKEHYSTAYDMALLAAEVLKNDCLRSIVSSNELTVDFGNPPYKRKLYNHNKLLTRYEHCIGVKTGYTKKAGRCLVSAAERDGLEVVAVTLNASDDWNIHENLLSTGLDMLQPTKVTADVSDFRVNVVGSHKSSIGVATDSFVIGTQEAKIDIDYNIFVPSFLYAPIKQGEIIGTIEYVYNGKVINKGNLYADSDVFYFEKKYSLKEKIIENIIAIMCNFL